MKQIKDLHICTSKTPTKSANLSDKCNSYHALEKCEGVKRKSVKRKSVKRKSKSKNKTLKKGLKEKPINLKNNFYHYVNNDWFTHTYVSKDTLNKSNFTILQKKVDKELLNCVKKYLIKDSEQCKALYVSTLNWNDALTENQTYLYIKQINEYRKDEALLYPFLKWSLYNGLITPLDFSIIHDIKHPKKYIATIGENGLSFNTKSIYFGKGKAHSDTREYYIKFIQAIFDLFFGKNNEYKAEDVFAIECELAKHMYTPEEANTVVKTYNKMSCKKAKSAYHFDATLLFKEFGLTNINNLCLFNPDYTKNAINLLQGLKGLKKDPGHDDWTSIKWNSYWVYKLLMVMSSFHSRLNAFVFEFFAVKIRGVDPKKPERDLMATYNICVIMNSMISKCYIKHQKNKKEIEFAKNLIDKLKQVFKERITKNTWLSSKTKELALNKINNLVPAVGYREKWIEDPNCNFFEYDAFGNNVKYTNWFYDGYKKQLEKPAPNTDYWLNHDEMNVFTVNAFYNNVKNEFILPNAILQKPFLDLDKDISYNLAYIGFIIAHEMVHGFDTEGCLFDKTGTFNYWWTDKDKVNYKILQDDVVAHYEALALKDGIKLDGHLTLDENIADISALNIVEDTLETYLIEQNIFGESQTAYFKDLYINYARQWRSKVSSVNQKNLLQSDPHSLSKYRVNCVLMRSKRFTTIFNIEAKDGMYYAGDLKEIW
jgi:putative endopeptidase